MKLSKEIVAFSNGNTKFYEQFMDYHFHKSEAEQGRKLGAYDATKPLAEKHDVVNAAYFAEVERLSNCTRNAENTDAWAANPMVRWANFAVINALVNAVLPAYVTESLAPFVDFRMAGIGDIVKVKVMPRTLYTVSAGGTGERTTFRQKKYAGDVVIPMQERIITTYVDMYRVMAGKEDIADFVRAIVLSIEIDMQKMAVAALNAGLAGASYPSQFLENAAFDAKKLIALAQRVQAYNNGIKPIIMGTASALANVLPDSTMGYRGTYDANGGSVHVLRDFYGFALYELPQMPTGSNYGLALDDNKLYVVSPVGSKLVVGAMSTTLTNSNQFYENADLTQNFTMRKNYGFEFVGSSFAGLYSITE